MRHFTNMGMIALFITAPGFAGAATFGPTVLDVPAGTPAVFDITVTSTGSGFDRGEFVVGTDAPAALSWSYHPDWDPAAPGAGLGAMDAAVIDPVFGLGLFGYVAVVGVGGESSGASYMNLALGSITIDTAGLAVGSYTVGIDSADGFSNLFLGAVPEGISGLGTLNVIPEPASLALLGLGAAAGIRRRRAQHGGA